MQPCKLILALDLSSRQSARHLLGQLDGELRWVKVGLQMFTAHGPEWVREIAELGYRIFLDLKLHDIPHTVAKSVQSLCHLPIDMLTLHSSGGEEMLAAAEKAKRELNPDLLLLGVTVLTSMNAAQLNRIGVGNTPEEQVANLAALTRDAGIGGLVCSGRDLVSLAPRFGRSLQFVTPGIRPAGSSAHDQKRVVTPRRAAELGSHYIVVGRPIHQAHYPRGVVRTINRELALGDS
ncbi:MAG: orotidine-5'-phosphate decarboxylase [Opitutae bacterium]|nr:orotidine-5'-phosphate decarboxylase [Opitutae bacterium]